MKRYWEPARNKVAAMSLRERAIIFAAVAMLLVFALNALLFEPLLARQKVVSAKLSQQQQEARTLQAAVQSIQQSRQDDAHSPLRARITQLRAQLLEGESFLKTRRDHLVDPEKMTALIEQVLRSNDQLHLVEMKTLPLSLLIEQNAKAPDAPQIYKHGVQITVRGSYADLLRYLEALEKLPNQMYWGELALSVEKHPNAVMTLTVYTLSLDKAWLTV
jgi:MSHA biogenesis protein MshJ